MINVNWMDKKTNEEVLEMVGMDNDLILYLYY